MRDESERIYQYEPLWGNWFVDEPIGMGSFGKVYRISYKEYNHTYTSAVKIISIPSDEQFEKNKSIIGIDTGTLRNHYQEMVQTLINEVNIFYSLSGNSNILGYHDHKIYEHKDKAGWDILIRMEYVKPLSKYLTEKRMTRANVITLGIDICTALDICAKRGIIHRDIKDENIFINDDGNFKLGDFGIAMKLSKSSWIASMKGTPHYMAPEVYYGKEYDAAVDIYSLGIVLYRLLNHGRLPHMPVFPKIIQPVDDEKALEKRMRGETFQAPDQAGAVLSRIIMKACAYQAKNRYSTPLEMKQDLVKSLNRLPESVKSEYVTQLDSRVKATPQKDWSIKTYNKEYQHHQAL